MAHNPRHPEAPVQRPGLGVEGRGSHACQATRGPGQGVQRSDVRRQPSCQALWALPSAPGPAAVRAAASWEGRQASGCPVVPGPTPGPLATLRLYSEQLAHGGGGMAATEQLRTHPTSPSPDGSPRDHQTLSVRVPPPRATPTQQRRWPCPLSGREVPGSRLPAPSDGHLGAQPA